MTREVVREHQVALLESHTKSLIKHRTEKFEGISIGMFSKTRSRTYQ